MLKPRLEEIVAKTTDEECNSDRVDTILDECFQRYEKRKVQYI